MEAQPKCRQKKSAPKGAEGQSLPPPANWIGASIWMIGPDLKPRGGVIFSATALDKVGHYDKFFHTCSPPDTPQGPGGVIFSRSLSHAD
jgi:hypothetical protein